MSCTVLIVSRWASDGPLFFWQACAKPRDWSTSPCTSAASSGVASEAYIWSSCRSPRHLTGAESPVPRGSQPTRSNAPRSASLPKDGAASLSQPTPATPGPPGLISSEPIRWPVAGLRTTASWSVPPAGLAQSTGTVTFAHWNPRSQLAHTSFWP